MRAYKKRLCGKRLTPGGVLFTIGGGKKEPSMTIEQIIKLLGVDDAFMLHALRDYLS